MRIIPINKCQKPTTPGPLLDVLLDDYDIVHNMYLENRVTMNLDNYDESNNSRYATRVIDFLGSNKTQIKKNVIKANMDTNWKNILERVLEMFDKELGKLSPPRNLDEKRKEYAYICTKRPFIALYKTITAHDNQQHYINNHKNKNENEKYTIDDYLSAL